MDNDGWTQVYLGGLDPTVHPTDEELEHLWAQRWNLLEEQFTWTGLGTSVVKRTHDGVCRGFAFLSFYSLEGATRAISVINNDKKHEGASSSLQAELCKPKKKKPTNHKTEPGQDYSNLRIRRQRTSKPVAKHPVIVNSTGKKTGLGNKTR